MMGAEIALYRASLMRGALRQVVENQGWGSDAILIEAERRIRVAASWRRIAAGSAEDPAIAADCLAIAEAGEACARVLRDLAPWFAPGAPEPPRIEPRPAVGTWPTIPVQRT